MHILHVKKLTWNSWRRVRSWNWPEERHLSEKWPSGSGVNGCWCWSRRLDWDACCSDRCRPHAMRAIARACTSLRRLYTRRLIWIRNNIGCRVMNDRRRKMEWQNESVLQCATASPRRIRSTALGFLSLPKGTSEKLQQCLQSCSAMSRL